MLLHWCFLWSPHAVIIMNRFPQAYCMLFYKCSFLRQRLMSTELIRERQDGSGVCVMLHPLCQARLAQHRGEKGTNKQMNKGIKRNGFLPGWLTASLCQRTCTSPAILSEYRWLPSGSHLHRACAEKKVVWIHGDAAWLSWSMQREQLWFSLTWRRVKLLHWI